MADPLYKPMTALLLEVGIGDQPHTGKTYIGHLLAVHRLHGGAGLRGRCVSGRPLPLGLRHRAVPGVQVAAGTAGEVRALIGERAERLAYLNCAMDRASFDAALERADAPVHDSRPPLGCRGLAGPRGFRRPVPGSPVRLAGTGARVRGTATATAGPRTGGWPNGWAPMPSPPTTASSPGNPVRPPRAFQGRWPHSQCVHTPHPSSGLTTLPPTSVRRKSRPW